MPERTIVRKPHHPGFPTHLERGLIPDHWNNPQYYHYTMTPLNQDGSLKMSDILNVLSKELHDNQATTKYGFTLKRICDLIKTHSHTFSGIYTHFSGFIVHSSNFLTLILRLKHSKKHFIKKWFLETKCVDKWVSKFLDNICVERLVVSTDTKLEICIVSSYLESTSNITNKAYQM